MNKPAHGIPRKTAQQDYTEIFSLSISIEIFEQEKPVYTTGSSQGLLIPLQRITDVLVSEQEKSPGRVQGEPSLLASGQKVQIPSWHLGWNPKLTLQHRKELTRCYSS